MPSDKMYPSADRSQVRQSDSSVPYKGLGAYSPDPDGGGKPEEMYPEADRSVRSRMYHRDDPSRVGAHRDVADYDADGDAHGVECPDCHRPVHPVSMIGGLCVACDHTPDPGGNPWSAGDSGGGGGGSVTAIE